MPFQPAPPQPKIERTVITFKEVFHRDLTMLYRRIEISTDQRILNNQQQLKEIITKLRALVDQLPT